MAQDSAEVGIVTFGGRVELQRELGPISSMAEMEFAANGNTPMGAAVDFALNKLDERKSLYQENGIDYYQPWLVLMTDGLPTDAYTAAAARTSDAVERKKLVVFPIGIGANADLSKLSAFSPTREPVRLAGLEFEKFFVWLSKSVQRVSASTPGDHVPLDIEGMKGWAEI